MDMTQPTLIMHRASSILLEFEEAATAGYQWEVNAPQGLWVRKIENKNETANQDTDDVVIGGTTTQRFMIMAEWAGDYELTFTHKRPWEDNDKTAETHTYKIHVPQQP
jgi:predicted secreted protein